MLGRHFDLTSEFVFVLCLIKSKLIFCLFDNDIENIKIKKVILITFERPSSEYTFSIFFGGSSSEVFLTSGIPIKRFFFLLRQKQIRRPINNNDAKGIPIAKESVRI